MQMSELSPIVLVIDDEIQIRRFLRTGFELNNFVVHEAGTGAEGIRSATLRPIDIVIVDLGLPDMDGSEVVERIRSWSTVPIIVLSVRSTEAQKVRLLEIGADDYVVKPFDPRELVARVHSVLRRARGDGDAGSKLGGAGESERISFEGWSLEVGTRQLTTPRQMVVPLSNAEFRLLWTFIERPRRVLNRDQLMDAARGQSSTAYDRSIDLLVSRLRQKLDDDPRDPKLLKTIRGEGYLFDARISR
jgi:two-component system OmpR family response regulator